MDIALTGLKITTGECVAESAVCSPPEILESIMQYIVPANTAAPMTAAKEQLNCKNEICVLTELKKRVPDRETSNAIDIIIRDNFKPVGPRENTELLSNVNIDGVLQQWIALYPKFYHCEFAMMDFIKCKKLYKLSTVNLDKDVLCHGFDCFACVLNTDVSTGGGKHWVCVFVDCRAPTPEPWTVEYFNSAGNSVTVNVKAWMKDAKKTITEYRSRMHKCDKVCIVYNTKIEHQRLNTECGVYVLYYIKRRLEGTPPAFFAKKPIADDSMQTFRQFLFRKE